MPISAQALAFRYPKAPLVLDGISCTIASGSITAIVGPNGSGKSTLIRLLAGLRSPESGSILLDGRDIKSYSYTQRAQRIAFIEQRPALAFEFSVRRVVEFGGYATDANRQGVDAALERFELAQLANKPFAHLSVGQQQRVSIARAWVQIGENRAGYLLADEPCSAMDPRHTQQTMNALRVLADSGVGVGVVVHDLSSAARWGDEAIVLDQTGRLVAHGPADEALTEPILSQVFEVPIRRHTITGAHPVLIPVDESPK